ncbi:MAG: transposase [Gammaproteobacteria bacterium]
MARAFVARGVRQTSGCPTTAARYASLFRPCQQVAEKTGGYNRPRFGESAATQARTPGALFRKAPVATERLSLPQGGIVRLALKMPYRHATTHVIFEPEDFNARIVALVRKASSDRARAVPGNGPASGNQSKESGRESRSDRQRVLTWAQRRRRVFAIDIETCRSCGGQLRVIASVEDPLVIGPVSACPEGFAAGRWPG